MAIPLLCTVVVRASSALPAVSMVASITVYVALFCWLVWRGISRLRIDLAHRAFERSYERLLDAVEAYRRQPGLQRLGSVRAAAAYSRHRWLQVLRVDDEAEADRSWVAMLFWVARWERRYS